MNPDQVLAPKIKEIAESLYSTSIDPKLIQLQKTKKEFAGDVTLVVFPFAKISKKSPQDTANELGMALQKGLPIISEFNVVQGFLNLVIKAMFFLLFL